MGGPQVVGPGHLNWGPGTGGPPPVGGQPPPLHTPPPDPDLNGPTAKKSKTLIHEIDAVLAANGMSRDTDPSAPPPFKISMHFKHPQDDPDGVLIQTYEQLGKKPKDKDDERPASTHYCVPMEVEVEFTDGRPSVKFPYTFHSGEEVPIATYESPAIFGQATKDLCAKTPQEEKNRRMYIVYLQALALRHMVKAGTNRESPYYDEAKQKIEAYMQKGKDQATFELDLTPGVKERQEQERARHRGLKNRNFRAIGIKISKDDKEPLILDFDKKTHFVSQGASGKIVKHKKGTEPAGSYSITSTEKNRRIPLILDSNDKTVIAEQKLAQLVPPADEKQHKAFTNELKAAGLSNHTILAQWPDLIEADIDLFKEKTKVFMNFPKKFFSFGTIRNFFMESVLKLRGTGRLRSCSGQVKKYMDDVRAGRLDASSKRKPRSQVGKAQRAYAQAAAKFAESEKAMNQYKLEKLNATKDAANQMSLSDFEGLAPDGRAAFENEWEAFAPTLTPAENLKWVSIKSDTSVASTTMNHLKRKFDTKKNGLKTIYQDFDFKLKELERLQGSMAARSNWLWKIQNEDEKIWDSFSNIRSQEGLRKRVFEISKSEGKARKQLAKIKEQFQPNPDFLNKINSSV